MESSEKFTNRLIHETSPYLLQHAHNPVDWYAWGDEAFERAKAEDKPVLVSIGYSACHWCHVMEHESFEDEATAAIMNEQFINIKVDMEERPDVDQIYMNFVQLTTGRGGWPMNVFLTPDKRPFFGGTYFPPQPRYGMPSWQQILTGLSEAYRNNRQEIDTSANEIVNELKRMSQSNGNMVDLSTDLLDHAFENHWRNFDAVNGGFGDAPKFPPSMSLEFLLRYHHRTGDVRALEIITRTLDKMACGGIYDQLGGGFHRYATDAIWLVPHFEKMLYDNAQLARIYLHAYQVTDNEYYKRIADETLEYVRREMLDASGGFYSTQDADSEGEEGKFFIWTPNEIEVALGKKEAAKFNLHYDVTAEGNYEGRNILNIKEPTATAPDPEARRRLFERREKRIKPNRDEKILTAWNGLMLVTFADAARILRNNEYLMVAEQNAAFILNNLQKDGRLVRSWKDGKAKLNAYIEDYANVADGLIALNQVTGKITYLSEAIRLAGLMITEFWDEENGGFFFTSNDHERLVVRNKDLPDNATPSGNSVAADVLLRLARLTGDDRFERFALTTMRLVADKVRRYPQGFGRMLSVIEFHLGTNREIAIVGPKGNELEKALHSKYLPNDVVILSSNPSADSAIVPLLKDREMIDGQATAYICENYVCSRPVTTLEDVISILSACKQA